MDGYEHLADPGSDWAPTKKDQRRQREREELVLAARRMAAGAPPVSDETLARVAALLARPTPPTELVNWRLRLFCGHVVNRTAHHTHTTIHGAFMGAVACAECGLDPATIVGAEALGRVAVPQPAARSEVKDERRIKAAIAHHERQIEELRRQLSD